MNANNFLALAAMVVVVAILPSSTFSYEYLNTLSGQVGELYCLNVPSVDGFLDRYHHDSNLPGGISYEEVEQLLTTAADIRQQIDNQINYYATKEHDLNFTDINYYNLMIYWHIRSFQCQSLHLMFEWAQTELMHHREDRSHPLPNVFDDGQFEMKLDAYIKTHYQSTLNLLNQTDFDVFSLVRAAPGHPTPKAIMANLETMQNSFLEVYTNATRDVIAPEHEKLSHLGLDFTMRAHVMIQSVLSYYHWLPQFLRDYRQQFQRHHPTLMYQDV